MEIRDVTRASMLVIESLIARYSEIAARDDYEPAN